MTERSINRFFSWVWLGMLVICGAAVLFAGAWWHLWTAALSAGMFIAFKLADDAEETEEEYDNNDGGEEGGETPHLTH